MNSSQSGVNIIDLYKVILLNLFSLPSSFWIKWYFFRLCFNGRMAQQVIRDPHSINVQNKHWWTQDRTLPNTNSISFCCRRFFTKTWSLVYTVRQTTVQLRSAPLTPNCSSFYNRSHRSMTSTFFFLSRGMQQYFFVCSISS
jgi:hypothetical protein